MRHCTRQQLDAAILQHPNVFAATPAEVLVRCASTARRICNEFAHFLAEKLRSGGAERTVFSARNTAPTCIGATDVSRFSNRNNLRRICKTRCAARRNGEKIAANSCVIDANFGKVLRMSDRWMRALSTSHAPASRRRNLAASECFCSDAGRTFRALRVDRTENLHRIRAFSGGKIAQWRRRTHSFFGAQHGADLHWSCADVLRVSNLNLRRKAAKFAALCVEMVKILQQIPASSMQILAKFCACSTAGCAHFRHCTHQQIGAAILKRRHVFAATLAELLVRSMRVDRAENLQRIRAFSGEKIA